MKPNKFYKERKPANDQSKWDHNDYDRLEKEDLSYQKNKYSKNRNNDNYYYRNPQKNDLNTLASDKYLKVYSEKAVERPSETDDKWKHDKFNENSKEMNNSFRKNKGKKNEGQGGKRFGNQKYEEKRAQTFNNFKQQGDLVEEKETLGNEDKLSNVSTANSDKKNQLLEEDTQNKKLDYELHIISEQGASFLRIDNINTFDENFNAYFEEMGYSDPYKNILIKIHFLKEIMEENKTISSSLIQTFEKKMNKYLEDFEILREKREGEENELTGNEMLNKWEDSL